VLVGAQISLAAGVLAVLIGAAIGTVLGCWPGITKAGGIASSCASATCCSLSRDPAGDCRGGGDGQRDVERDHRGGDLSIPAFARLVRGNTLVLKQQTFIESARSIGASDATILFSHILPGTVSSIVVYFTMRIGVSIISAASLSFWGSARSRRRRSGGDAQRGAGGYGDGAARGAVPGVAIFLTVLAFNLLGDGLRDALDPRIKG
jgi:glutathione transport system permease protein